MARLVSVADLVTLLAVSDKTVQKRLKELEFKPGPQNSKLYDSVKAINLILGKVNDLTVERSKLARVQAEKTQIEVDRLRNELVPIEDVARVVESQFTAVRAGLISIPSKTSQEISHITGVPQPEVQKIIEDVVNEALSELSADRDYADKKPPQVESSEVITDEPSTNEATPEESTGNAKAEAESVVS